MSADSAMEDLPAAVKNRLLATCMMAIFLAALDQTIVAPALPVMAREFGNWADISWVVTSYLLVTTAVIPIYGKASDIFGRRPAMGVAITIFCLGSLLCAVSSSILTLSLARGIQALGGGGIQTSATETVSASTPSLGNPPISKSAIAPSDDFDPS